MDYVLPIADNRPPANATEQYRATSQMIRNFGVRMSPKSWTPLERILEPYKILQRIMQEHGDDLSYADLVLPIPYDFLVKHVPSDKNCWEVPDTSVRSTYFVNQCKFFRERYNMEKEIADVGVPENLQMTSWNTVLSYWGEACHFHYTLWLVNSRCSKEEIVTMGFDIMEKVYKKHGDLTLYAKNLMDEFTGRVPIANDVHPGSPNNAAAGPQVIRAPPSPPRDSQPVNMPSRKDGNSAVDLSPLNVDGAHRRFSADELSTALEVATSKQELEDAKRKLEDAEHRHKLAQDEASEEDDADANRNAAGAVPDEASRNAAGAVPDEAHPDANHNVGRTARGKRKRDTIESSEKKTKRTLSSLLKRVREEQAALDPRFDDEDYASDDASLCSNKTTDSELLRQLKNRDLFVPEKEMKWEVELPPNRVVDCHHYNPDELEDDDQIDFGSNTLSDADVHEDDQQENFGPNLEKATDKMAPPGRIWNVAMNSVFNDIMACVNYLVLKEGLQLKHMEDPCLKHACISMIAFGMHDRETMGNKPKHYINGYLTWARSDYWGWNVFQPYMAAYSEILSSKTIPGFEGLHFDLSARNEMLERLIDGTHGINANRDMWHSSGQDIQRLLKKMKLGDPQETVSCQNSDGGIDNGNHIDPNLCPQLNKETNVTEFPSPAWKLSMSKLFNDIMGCVNCLVLKGGLMPVNLKADKKELRSDYAYISMIAFGMHDTEAMGDEDEHYHQGMTTWLPKCYWKCFKSYMATFTEIVVSRTIPGLNWLDLTTGIVAQTSITEMLERYIDENKHLDHKLWYSVVQEIQGEDNSLSGSIVVVESGEEDNNASDASDSEDSESSEVDPRTKAKQEEALQYWKQQKGQKIANDTAPRHVRKSKERALEKGMVPKWYNEFNDGDDESSTTDYVPSDCEE